VKTRGCSPAGRAAIPRRGETISRPNLSANVPFHIEGPCQRRGRAPCSTRGFRRRRPGRPRGHRCARRCRGSRRHASRTRPCAARRERRGRAPGWPGGWRRRSGWHAPDRRPGAICATGRGRQLRIGCDQPRSPPEDRLPSEWQSGAEGSRTLDLLNAMRRPGVHHRASLCVNVRNLRRASVPKGPSWTAAHRPTRTEPAQARSLFARPRHLVYAHSLRRLSSLRASAFQIASMACSRRCMASAICWAQATDIFPLAADFATFLAIAPSLPSRPDRSRPRPWRASG